MKNLKEIAIDQVMTYNPVSVFPQMKMIEVVKEFDRHNFHHLVVLDEEERCVGMITMSDYRQLQHHMTKIVPSEGEKNNRLFLSSLIASDVMTPNPVCISILDTMQTVLNIFLENKIHALVVKDVAGRVVGIVTPFDILKYLNAQVNLLID